jgi:hypothetical protein
MNMLKVGNLAGTESALQPPVPVKEAGVAANATANGTVVTETAAMSVGQWFTVMEFAGKVCTL